MSSCDIQVAMKSCTEGAAVFSRTQTGLLQDPRIIQAEFQVGQSGKETK